MYDISRWGRFQDADESAYCGYICKRVCISVICRAEQFENDRSPVSTIIKGVIRLTEHNGLSLDVYRFETLDPARSPPRRDSPLGQACENWLATEPERLTSREHVMFQGTKPLKKPKFEEFPRQSPVSREIRP